jgi:hypothetical protein
MKVSRSRKTAGLSPSFYLDLFPPAFGASIFDSLGGSGIGGARERGPGVHEEDMPIQRGRCEEENKSLP